MSRNQNETSARDRVSLYPAWCKRCGICVAFCPTEALREDEWGYPQFAAPDKCTACHLCEKLCPDFAITVGAEARKPARSTASSARPGEGTLVEVNQRKSPERLAPE